jgi:2-C-methyl-D-erythritol 4-phosphate cytidylyltransferase
MGRITAILPASGLGTRMGAETPKQFLELDGTPIVIHSLRRIASCPLVTDIIVATRADVLESLQSKIQAEKFTQSVRMVRGGDSRQDSVAQALREVPDDTEIVLVHDAVRPFVTVEQITRVIEEARKCKAAILGIPAMDTVKEVKRASLPEDVALIIGTIPRERVVLAQTPQAFSAKLLKEAFARAEADGVNASDEAGLVERIGHDVHVVLGSERNIKITRPADMELARFYLERGRIKLSAGLKCRLIKGRRGIRTAMFWPTRFATHFWERPDWAISARIFLIPIRSGKALTVCSFWSTRRSC